MAAIAVSYDCVYNQITYSAFALGSGVEPVYQMTTNNGGNAVWMDTQNVLVQNTQGMYKKLIPRSHQVKQQWNVVAGQLSFYASPTCTIHGQRMCGLARLLEPAQS